MQIKPYDVVIVGGGMVGASLAALLPKELQVLVLESNAMPNNPIEGYQPSFDARTTAISRGSHLILQQAGIWKVLAQHVQAIADVHVSDKGHWGSVKLSREQLAWPALGYVVENAWLGRSLLHVLAERSNVKLFCPAKVTGIKVVADGVLVNAEQNQATTQFHAKLLVVADGAASDSCRYLGIDHDIHSYGHTALIANVSTAQAHKGIAYERFTKSGPIALLPQQATNNSPHRSALIWTLPEDEAKQLQALDDKAFLAELQQRFGSWQGEFTRIGARHSYPLKLSKAREQIRQHIVVLGNAAHSLHPVAGQGFNLALRDAQVLSDLLKKAKQADNAIGDLSVLNRYMDQQLNDQDLTILFSDKLPSVFSQPSPLIQLGRNLSLLGLELLPPLKQSFTRFAAGMRQQENFK